MKIQHVMIDVESLGLTPGSLLRSVCAVAFDLDTAEIGRHSVWKISMLDSINSGFFVEPSSLKWWMMRSDEARRSFVEGKEYTIQQFITSFNHFFDSLNADDIHVWALQSDFDIAMLRSYYSYNARRKNKENWALPFPRKNIHDVYTCLRYLKNTNNLIPRYGNEHDPYDDCINQINIVKHYIQLTQKENSPCIM